MDEITEKKRKYSIDSLEEEKKKSFEQCFEKLEETGLNAQFIAKNDRKLIKLRIINSNYKLNDSPKTNTIGTFDIDDLPSESDLSSCKIIALPNINTIEHLPDRTFKNNTFDNEGTSESTKQNSSEFTKKISKRTYICNECGKEFYSQNSLNKHMFSLHDIQKPFLCVQCQMSFDDVSAKKRHEKEHLAIKQFRCCICSFEFTRASNLRTHLLKMHPNDVGKTVIITKSNDNKLNFEFNLNIINNRKNSVFSNNLIVKPSQDYKNDLERKKDNKIIYIKDPQNKNAEIQHMVVYIDGKPIFLQKNQTNNSNRTNLIKEKNIKVMNNLVLDNRPIIKMPYLLEDVATSTSNSLQNNNQHEQKSSSSKSLETKNTIQESKQLKRPDQDYLQIVSMLKQKNEKLVCPYMQNKKF